MKWNGVHLSDVKWNGLMKNEVIEYKKYII